jgi:WD40 repeat protein
MDTNYSHSQAGSSYYEEEEEGMYEYEDNDRAGRSLYGNQADQQADSNSHVLNLKWTLGFNYSLVNGAINLTRSKSEYQGESDKTISEIFYVVGHTGVIYDYVKKSQRLLQGHCNAITSVAYSHAKRIIITADKGPNSLLVVWDVNTGTPRKCIFDPHPHGVECLDVSEDGRIIITLSREEPEARADGKRDHNPKYYSQTVSVWDWELEEDPCVSSGVIEPDSPGECISYQKYVQINYKKPDEFATTGKNKVYFWKMEVDGVCSYYSPQTSHDSRGKKGKGDKKDKHYSKNGVHSEFDASGQWD